MVHMLRSRSWVQLTRTYGFDRLKSARARDKRAARRLIDESWEDVEEARRLRACWNFHYSLYPAEFADRVLDKYEIPKPPSRERRMPE